ncbi:MAG TPA: hypothetical protein VKU42_11035, partial [Candidatus Angelobacter sp.]|nr:hypothetical protein [Candidatus Angelobacter sp.]
MAWCLQCGLNGQPVKAIGKDDDGEDACAAHCTKRQPVKAQPEKSKAVTKKCICGCGEEFTPTGNRQLYKEGHK